MKQPIKAKKKKKSPLYVNDENDYRYRAYSDSSSLHNYSKDIQPIYDSPKIDKSTFNSLSKKEDSYDLWSVDEEMWDKDKSSGALKSKSLEDYIVNLNDNSKRSTDVKEHESKVIANSLSEKITKSKKGVVKKKAYYEGEYIGYDTYDPLTGVSKFFGHDGKLQSINSSKIQPSNIDYYGKKEKQGWDGIETNKKYSKNGVLEKQLSKKYRNYSHDLDAVGRYMQPKQEVIVDPKKAKSAEAIKKKQAETERRNKIAADKKAAAEKVRLEKEAKKAKQSEVLDNGMRRVSSGSKANNLSGDGGMSGWFKDKRGNYVSAPRALKK